VLLPGRSKQTLEGTLAREKIDRNRIDRLPTPGERWVGIILSALMAVVFLPLTVVTVHMLLGEGQNDHLRRNLVMAIVFALLGAAGCFFFYRMAFTKPKALSSKANRIYAWIFVGIIVPLCVLSLIFPAPISIRAGLISLLGVGLGNLAISRTKSPQGRRS
jgi:hypothetical protein